MSVSNNLPSITFTRFNGVDIAAKDFTAAILNTGNNVKPKLVPKTFSHNAEGFEKYIQWLGDSDPDKVIPPCQQLVVLEATGSYWVALASALHAAGFVVAVINPAQAHYFAKALLKRAKSDALAAQTLAQLGQALQARLVAWTPPPQLYQELRQRLSQRDNLIRLRNGVSNQLHALLVQPIVIVSVREQLEALITTFSQQLEIMEQEIKTIVEADNEWGASIKLLQTIPGIGLLTACWLVVATFNFTTCERVESLVSYIGLAPMERSSVEYGK